MFNLGPMELVVILVLALVIFGPGKLPEVGKALGKSLNEFRQASREGGSTPQTRPVRPATAGSQEGASEEAGPAPAGQAGEVPSTDAGPASASEAQAPAGGPEKDGPVQGMDLRKGPDEGS